MSTPNERADHLRAMTEDAARDDAYATVSGFVQTRGERADHGLREHISAVQCVHFPTPDGLLCDCGQVLPGGDIDDEPMRLHLADVVIRDLGLRECRDPHCHCLHEFVSGKAAE